LAPCLQQASADERVFDARARIEIPAVAGPARTAAGLVVGKIGARARIVRLLGFPGDDPALHVDFPGARSGAVHAVGGPHDLVRGPALPVGVLPLAALVCCDAVSVRERVLTSAKKGEAIQKMAHTILLRWPH